MIQKVPIECHSKSAIFENEDNNQEDRLIEVSEINGKRGQDLTGGKNDFMPR